MTAPAQDTGVPLVSAATFQAGAFADLARSYDAPTLARIMVQATRACETETGRRLAPFAGITESHRAYGIDPDEYVGGDLPLDLVGTVGRSYANALSSTALVRRFWVREFAPQFAEMWTYANVVIEIVRSYGGGETLTATRFQGPEPDNGHTWFNLGTFLPVGSMIRVKYDGGYATCPADLERACMYMAASIIVKELDPAGDRGTGHNASSLEADAVSWLNGYMRAS